MTKRKKLLLALTATVVALLIAELGARFVFWLKDDVPPTADPSLENEWEWAAVHLEAGRATFESDYVHDPITGWRLRPDLATARSLPVDHLAPDAPHVLFVGDSYTFGEGVEGHETFASVLGRELLPGWRVTNLAVPGTGTDQQVITFEREGVASKPDVVVLGFYVRDFARNVVTFRDYAKPRFVVDDDELELIGTPVPSPEQLFEDYRSGRREIGRGVRSYLVGILGSALSRIRSRNYDEDSEGWQVLRRLMARFVREVRVADAVPVWLVIPYRDVVDGGSSHFEPLEALCEARSEELGMACLRLDAPFRAFVADHDGESPYRPRENGGHLSVAGHRVAAEALHAFLRDRGLLKTRD